MAKDILDVCDPTPDGYRYILVIADYFSKWTEAFPIKNKCAYTVADMLVEKIICGLVCLWLYIAIRVVNLKMDSCTLLGCTKTGTAPYRSESDGMIEWFNRTCLMILSMFVNDRRDNWNELLPYVMRACRTSVHKSTGYHTLRFASWWEKSAHCRRMFLFLNSELTGNTTFHHTHLRLGYGMHWRPHMITFESHYIGQRSDGNGYTMLRQWTVHSLFGPWVLRYYPPGDSA